MANYSTDNLPPNTYFVRIPEYHAAGKKVEIPIEGGATCNIELSAVSHLRGKVFKSNGQPHANQGNLHLQRSRWSLFGDCNS